MSDPLPLALPYGLRDVKLTPYTDNSNTVLGTPVDLPVSRTLSFSETEDFNELEGDDETVASHGSGPKVAWELESGGIPMAAWAVLSGGTYTPDTNSRVLKKSVKQSRPYFKIEGQIISDSGGDIHCEIFRAKCDDTLDGNFAYGEFMLTACKGTGFGSQLENLTGSELTEVKVGDLYRFIQNGVAQTISPGVPAPSNLSSGATTTTTVALDWSAAAGSPTNYKVYQRVVGGPTTWVASTTTPTGGSLTGTSCSVTGLTTATHYEFVVRAVKVGVESGNSNVDNATTA